MKTMYVPRHPSWYPAESFVDTQGRPHIILIMRHEIDKAKGELLRGEVLVILAASISRMETLYLEEHVYIPVRVHFPVHPI